MLFAAGFLFLPSSCSRIQSAANSSPQAELPQESKIAQTPIVPPTPAPRAVPSPQAPQAQAASPAPPAIASQDGPRKQSAPRQPGTLSACSHDPLVFAYHDIVPAHSNVSATSDVTLTAFQKQMDLLVQQGYSTYTVDDWYALSVIGKDLPPKSILLTFDDGYEGEYALGVPEMAKRGMKATFFVHTGYVGTTTTKQHVTWEELKAMSETGKFSIQSHTVTHPNLTTLTADQLQIELTQPIQAIESHLVYTPIFFAYPYGAFNEVVQAEARKYYKIAFALGDPSQNLDSALQVPRMSVDQGLEDIAVFKKTLDTWILPHSCSPGN